jgi:hypothetical protein
MPDQTCGSCRYWGGNRAKPGDGYSSHMRCMRYPPTETQLEPYRQIGPYTHDTDWCGEHKPKARSHDSKDWPHPSVRGQG